MRTSSFTNAGQNASSAGTLQSVKTLCSLALGGFLVVSMGQCERTSSDDEPAPDCHVRHSVNPTGSPGPDSMVSATSGNESVTRVSAPLPVLHAQTPLPFQLRAKAFTARPELTGLNIVIRRRGPGDAWNDSDEAAGAESLPSEQAEMRRDVVSRTSLVRVGDRSYYEQGMGDRVWFTESNTVWSVLNRDMGLIEHYALRGEDLELSWVLEKKPKSDGDLLIETMLDGMRFAGYTGANVDFVDATGEVGLRVGEVTLIDARGREKKLMMEGANGLLRLRVSRAILDESEFPIVLDPLLSPQTRTGIGLGYGVSSNGRGYLMVWGFDAKAMAMRLSSTGEVLDPSGIVVGTASHACSVASNGRDYLVVRPDRNRILGTRVSAAGDVLDPSGITIVTATTNTYPPVAVASDGTNYLVVWEEQTPGLAQNDSVGLYAARVSAAGVVLDTNPIVLPAKPLPFAYFIFGSGYEPSVACNGTNYLVAWQDRRAGDADIYAVRVALDGTVLDANGIVVCAASSWQIQSSVAANKGDFLVVWADYRHSPPSDIYSGETDIYGARVAGTTGAVLDPDGFSINNYPGKQYRPSAASRGNSYLVGWRDVRTRTNSEVYCTWITSDGRVTDGNGIAVCREGQGTDLNYFSSAELTTDGHNYLLGYYVWGWGVNVRLLQEDGLEPWWNQDIGRTGEDGGALSASGLFLLSGAGQGIGRSNDAFHYAYRTFGPSGQIMACLTAISASRPDAEAGLMFRDTLNSNSAYVFLGVTPPRGGVFETRLIAKGPTIRTSTTAQSPLWLRLVRLGNTFIGYSSPDGQEWNLDGFTQVTLPDQAHVGLAVSSHAETSCSASFSNVSVSLTGILPGGDVSGPRVYVGGQPVVDTRAPRGRGLQLLVAGRVGEVYVLQATTDFTQWSSIGLRRNILGVMDFIDQDATNASMRWYRAIRP